MMAQSVDPTVPLDESFIQVVAFYGRQYQRYSLENNVCFSPVDEDEIERLHVSHEALKMVFDNRLIFPPIQRLRRVLDCGYGSGLWAAEVARQTPNCQVVGVDISPHMALEDELPNLDLQVDDLNRRFTFEPNEFDLVHSQMVVSGINADRWRHYLRDMHRVLRPGGWCQIVEVYFQAQSDNGSLTDSHALRRWSTLYLQALSQYKDPRAPMRIEAMVRNAGFTEVESQVMQLPMCGWPTDPRMNQVGRLNEDSVQGLLESDAMYLFTERLGMSYVEAQALIAQARVEAANPAIKGYFPLYVCIGRKRR